MTSAFDRLKATVPLGLAAALGGLGCDTATGLVRDTEPPIQTDVLEYELDFDGLRFRVDISYVYTNRSGNPVYLVNCNGGFGLHLERDENGAWQYAWGPVLNRCLSPPIVIASNATFADTLHVRAGSFGSNSFPQFDVDDPSGTYRIVWTAALSSLDANQLPFGPQIPFEYRVSNRFTLRK